MTVAEPDNTLPPDLSALDGPPPYDLDHLGDSLGEPPDLSSWEEAEWATRQLARASAEIDATMARYDAQRAKLDHWLEDATRGAASKIAFLQGRLERWAVAQRARTHTATFRFPAATVKTTHRKDPRVAVADEKVVLAWLHESWTEEEVRVHGVISTTEKLRVSALRDHLDIDGVTVVDPDTGEAVPGVFVEPPATTATVSINPDPTGDDE